MTDDPRALDVEHIDAEVRRVRALARALVGSEHDGDDVAQQAWVTVLSGPPREGWSLRSWLAGIARNHARQLRRTERRRLQRELTAAASRDSHAMDDTIERLDLLRHVLDQVRQLDEPYRATMLLRFVDGHPPVEVARRLGVPHATVRTRLKRGIEQLRARMDATIEGGRSAWLVPFATSSVAEVTKPAAAGAAAGCAVVKTTTATFTIALLTMKKSTVAVLALAAVLVGSWAIVAENAAGIGTPPSDSPTSARTASQAVRENMEAATGSTLAQTGAPGIEVLATPRRESAPEAPTTAAGPPYRTRVRVVDARDRSPVAGATIAWIPHDFDERTLDLEARRLKRSDSQRFLLNHGAHVVTDANGESIVEHTPNGLRLEVWTQELYAAGRFQLRPEPGRIDPSPDPFVIPLEPDFQVTVRAVDSNGRPVAGVGISAEPQGWTGPGLVRARPDLGTTNTAGELVWRHPQQFAKDDDNAHSVVLVATILGARFGHTELRFDDFPSKPVDIEVPAHGEAAIRVLDHAGRPCMPDRLDLRCEDGRRRLLPVDLQADESGTPTIVPVALGKQIELTAQFPLASLSTTVSGPAWPGERVSVALAPTPRSTTVRARVVDEAGRPLDGVFCIWLVPIAGEPHAAFVPIRGGELTVLAPPELDGIPLRVEVTERPRDNEVPRIAASETPRKLAPGVNDFAELAFTPIPRVFAVETIRADGSPVPTPVEFLPPLPQGGWSSWPTGEGIVRDPESGLTALHAVRPAERYRVRAQKPWLLLGADGKEQVDFMELPTTEEVHTVRVVSGGSLTAELLVDDDTPWDGLVYELVPSAPPGGGFLRPTREPAGQNPCVYIAGLSGGFYELQISCFGASEPLVTIRDLEVRPDGACDDERLRGIDLRGRVRSLALRVVDAAGEPVNYPRAFVTVMPTTLPTRHPRGRPVDSADGRVRLEVPGPVDVIASSAQHMTVMLRGVNEDRTITLPEPPTMRLTAPGLSGLDMAGAKVVLTLTHAQDLGLAAVFWTENGSFVGTSGLAETIGALSQNVELTADQITGEHAFRCPGRYRIEATLQRDGDAPFTHELPLEPSVIDVRAGDDGRKIEIALDATALTSALQKAHVR